VWPTISDAAAAGCGLARRTGGPAGGISASAFGVRPNASSEVAAMARSAFGFGCAIRLAISTLRDTEGRQVFLDCRCLECGSGDAFTIDLAGTGLSAEAAAQSNGPTIELRAPPGTESVYRSGTQILAYVLVYGWLALMVAATLLWIRIVLESIIVVFDIAMCAAQSIRRCVRARKVESQRRYWKADTPVFSTSASTFQKVSASALDFAPRRSFQQIKRRTRRTNNMLVVRNSQGQGKIP